MSGGPSRWLSARPLADIAAVALFGLCLAYHWLGNAAHEVLGTALLAFVLLHIVLNRRWWRMLPRTGRRDAVKTVVNLAMLAAMGLLLVSSVTVSRLTFAWLGMEGGLSARDWHILAAWWTLVALGLHLGVNIERLAQFLPRVRGSARRIFQALIVLLACLGISSASELGLVDKLQGVFGFEMWDFRTNAPMFFVHLAALSALLGLTAYLAMRFNRRWASGRVRARPSPDA